MTDERKIHKVEEGEPFIWGLFTNLFEPVDCNSLYLYLRALRDEHGFDTEVQVLPTGQVKVFPKTIIYADMLEDEDEDEDEDHRTYYFADAGQRLGEVEAANDSEALRLAVEKYGGDLRMVYVTTNDGPTSTIDGRTIWAVSDYESQVEALKAISAIIADPAVKARTLETRE